MEFKNSEEHSDKVKYLLEYFSGKLDRREKEKKYYDRAKKLEKMMEIYESDDLDIRKIAKMHEIYRTSKDFICKFKDLEKYSDDKVLGYFVRKAKKIGEYYQKYEEKGIIKEAVFLLQLEEKGYFDDYVYASDFVNEYIKYEESPYLNDFFKEFGLNKMQFERFIEIVKKLDEELFEKYVQKSAINQELRKQDVTRKVNNLSEGAKNGILSDNTTFDAVEYFANLPFYDDESSKEVLKDFNLPASSNLETRLKCFFNSLDSEKASAIINYANSNKIHFNHIQILLTEDGIMKTNYIVDGYALTDEDKEKIIDYMKKRKIPFLPKAYAEVRSKYLKQGLDTKKLNLRK